MSHLINPISELSPAFPLVHLQEAAEKIPEAAPSQPEPLFALTASQQKLGRLLQEEKGLQKEADAYANWARKQPNLDPRIDSNHAENIRLRIGLLMDQLEQERLKIPLFTYISENRDSLILSLENYQKDLEALKEKLPDLSQRIRFYSELLKNSCCRLFLLENDPKRTQDPEIPYLRENIQKMRDILKLLQNSSGGDYSLDLKISHALDAIQEKQDKDTTAFQQLYLLESSSRLQDFEARWEKLEEEDLCTRKLLPNEQAQRQLNENLSLKEQISSLHQKALDEYLILHLWAQANPLLRENPMSDNLRNPDEALLTNLLYQESLLQVQKKKIPKELKQEREKTANRLTNRYFEKYPEPQKEIRDKDLSISFEEVDSSYIEDLEIFFTKIEAL